MIEFSPNLLQRLPSTDQFVTIGEGWIPLVEKLNKDIAEFLPNYKILQIKEKFGGLRFYVAYDESFTDLQIAEMEALIKKAEMESFKICDVCGAVGKIISTSPYWLATRCEQHLVG